MWKKKLFRVGVVEKIGEEKINVKLFSKDLPAACAAKGCSACKSHSPEMIREYDKKSFVDNVTVGDIVKVEAWQISDGVAATALFMIPILFSAVFYHIAIVVGVSQDSIISVLIAVLGAIFGFLISFVFDKIFRKLNPTKIFKE